MPPNTDRRTLEQPQRRLWTMYKVLDKRGRFVWFRRSYFGRAAFDELRQAVAAWLGESTMRRARRSHTAGSRAVKRFAIAAVIVPLVVACGRGEPRCPSPVPSTSNVPDKVPASEHYYGPGYDVVWLGGADDPEYAWIADGRAVVVRRDHSGFVGTDFASLQPIGFKVRGRVFDHDSDALYVLTEKGDFLRVALSGRTQRLFHAAWEIDSVKVDNGAFYVSQIDDRRRVPKHHEEIWRVPKRRSAAKRLYRKFPGDLVSDFRSDGSFLFVGLWREMRQITERVPITGGRPEELGCGEHMPVLSDAKDHYFIANDWLWRQPRAGGPKQSVVQTRIPPSLVDERNVYFLEYNELVATAKAGGTSVLLGDFVGAEEHSQDDCDVCGSWKDAVCVQCPGIIYRVPKRPREHGYQFAYHGSDGLALDKDALYWGGGIERVSRNTADGHDGYAEDSAQRLSVTELNAWSSRPVVDGTNIYNLSDDGILFRLPKAGGAPQTLWTSAPLPQFDDGLRRRLVADDADFVYALDLSRNAVIRVSKTTGTSVSLGTAVPAAEALLADDTSLYVLFGPEALSEAETQPYRLAFIDKATGTVTRTVIVIGSRPRDMASTNAAIYVSFEEGELLRVSKTDGGITRPIPLIDHGTYEWAAIEAHALAGVEDRLFFVSPGLLLELVEGRKFPSVLATGVSGDSLEAVADEAGVYFSQADQAKGEHWIEVGFFPRRL